MEAAKSQFSYIWLRCEVLLKARKRLLVIRTVKAVCNSWELWVSERKLSCLWCW